MATQTEAGAPANPEADVAEGTLSSGNYEVLKRRLETAAKALREKADALNVKRQEAFGGSELAIIGSERVRTENNCVPRDIVALGDHLLFGYNVHIQLREQTEVEEVLSLHRFETTETGFDFPAVSAAQINPGLFGTDAFQRHFRELFDFYARARLAHMRINDAGDQLMVVFKVGDNLGDIKVMRWRLDQQRSAAYLDNRGERDYVFPPSHDFRWTPTTRENQRTGRAPHISVLDKVFVGAHDGKLVLKIEDNTESGKAILSESVEDDRQALDDLKVEFAEVGTLILLKILPFRESVWRYLVYNTRAGTAERIDAIGQACVSLPEDHGIIFPGGYYLQMGEFKVFDVDTTDLAFKRAIRSPNGEDVLYVFYQRDKGDYTLLPYNMIRQAVQNPIHCDGYCLYEDGRMVVFSHAGSAPTRVHPMQVWQTPFTSAEFAASSQGVGGFLGKVGNADLVRGISEAHTIVRRVQNQTPTRQRYEDLVAAVTRALDSYYWLGDEAVGDFKQTLEQLRLNAEQIIDEFEKVLAMRGQAEEAVTAAEATQDELLRGLDYARWTDVDPFMTALAKLRSQRGHLITLREMRYIDLGRLGELETAVSEAFDRVSKGAVEFLLGEKALAPLIERAGALLGKVEATEKVAEMKPLAERLDALTTGLNLLSEVVSTLDIEDATARTRILEGISEAFSHLNRVRAIYQSRRKELLGREGRDAFAAQFRLFGQSVGSAIAIAETPDACDTQLSRMMVQLEELESRFSEFDAFLETLAVKRDEVYEAFSTKKQTLLDAVQRRAQNMASAGARVLDGITRRARSFRAEDELNGYFASDQMVLKLKQLAGQLLELGDSVRADELMSKVKAAQQHALRGLRDKLELFDEGTDVIKFGRHRFNVNTQPLELTMVPRDQTMALHLTGTDYFESIDDPAFEATRRFWTRDVISESAAVYRGEFLAASIFFAAEASESGLTMTALQDAALDPGDGLLKLVRRFASDRFAEGYERGLHDADAAAILGALLTLSRTAGLLRFSANARALACLFWAFHHEGAAAQRFKARALSLGQLQTVAETTALSTLGAELALEMTAFFGGAAIPARATDVAEAGRYLALELTSEVPQFATSGAAETLRGQVVDLHPGSLEADLRRVGGDHDAQLLLAQAWVEAAVVKASSGTEQDLAPYALEASVLCLTGRSIARVVSQAVMHTTVDGLLGQHANVVGRQMVVRLDELLPRLRRFLDEEVPAYRAYRAFMAKLVQRRRAELRIDEFKPRVLTSFVRNKLINDVYLPLLGDNFAKQMGAVGAGKRTDLMGLLLLISPPGYGKTTLMEYVASRLGLVFMKINGPSLGHAVHSLDPAEAPNATARQEVEKINLALEMGNNVMLYLDDIQHTHPELLQKFISLCDAQRRIEGVWNGETRTYDLRGKKFCVVMAGNPYTESGESFQIPDMLANRADIYNLGDILAGQRETFSLSYLENSLTSNATLAPIATRGQADFYKLVRMAKGDEVPTSDLGHSYSAAELAEIMRVLGHLFRAQEVLLKVNQQYIASASMDDKYRTEPPFKLQGSYRNMNKLSEKIVAALNDVELEAILDDHYVGEAQTLTTGAEANLLKLREMRGVLTDAQAERWADIKQEFVRQRSMGGAEDDPSTRVIGQLSLVVQELDAIRGAVAEAATQSPTSGDPPAGEAFDSLGGQSGLLAPLLLKLHEALEKLRRPQLAVRVEQAPQPEFARFFDAQNRLVQQTLLPVAQAAAKNLEEGSHLTRELIALIERLEAAGARPSPR